MTTNDDSSNEDNEGTTDPAQIENTADKPKKKRKVHKLSLSSTTDFNAQLAQRGIVYVARVPPHMNPAKVKHLMSQHGVVTRVYLQPADKKKSRAGHKRYTEGWVEFEDKKLAKRVANALHQTPIANKGPLAGDLWSLKYLRKFRWEYLTEKVAYERRVREQKLRLETMQARKEANYYKRQLETNQKLDYIEDRKKVPSEGVSEKGENVKKQKRERQFKTLDEGASRPSQKILLDSLL